MSRQEAMAQFGQIEQPISTQGYGTRSDAMRFGGRREL